LSHWSTPLVLLLGYTTLGPSPSLSFSLLPSLHTSTVLLVVIKTCFATPPPSSLFRSPIPWAQTVCWQRPSGSHPSFLPLPSLPCPTTSTYYSPGCSSHSIAWPFPFLTRASPAQKVVLHRTTINNNNKHEKTGSGVRKSIRQNKFCVLDPCYLSKILLE